MSIPTYKVCFLGKIEVGKTSLYRRLQNKPYVNRPSRTTPNDGLNQCFVELSSPSGTIKVDLWDTTGNERYQRTLTTHHYRNAHLVLCVYDVTDEDSLDQLHPKEPWLEDAKRYSLRNAVYLLCGNKVDICEEDDNDDASQSDGRVNAERVKGFMDAVEIYDSHVLVSAKTDEGLEDLKEMIIRSLTESNQPSQPSSALTLRDIEKRNAKESCCS